MGAQPGRYRTAALNAVRRQASHADDISSPRGEPERTTTADAATLSSLRHCQAGFVQSDEHI
jgi:hypothetical protein